MAQQHGKLEEYETEAILYERYAESVRCGENLFSSDPQSSEYSFFVQYEQYALSLAEPQISFLYEEDKAQENIRSLSEQIDALNIQNSGLSLLLESIDSGINKVADMPVYNTQYLRYAASLDALEIEYKAQQQAIEMDNTLDSNTWHTDEQLSKKEGYTLLLQSIQQDSDKFSQNYESIYYSLYLDYIYQLERYVLAYDSAQATYDHLVKGGGTEIYYEDMVEYQQTMLDGYTVFRNSVTSGQDQFSSLATSYAYHSLYVAYKEKYDLLSQQYEIAVANHNNLLAMGGDEYELQSSQAIIDEALRQQNEYEITTLAEIDNTILQIRAAIAEINVSMGTGTQAYQVETARVEMIAAENMIETYKNQKIAEYQDIISQLSTSVADLEFSEQLLLTAEERLEVLEKTYHKNVDDINLSTIAQINSSLQSVQTQLSTANSNLRLYQLAQEMYGNSKVSSPYSDDVTIQFSYAQLSALSSAIEAKESLDSGIAELKGNIAQTTQQIALATTYAGQTGTISLVNELAVGDVISAGYAIATIVPGGESEYKVQLYASNKDIANIEVGATIKYDIAAIPSRQYGTITGIVTYVGADTVVQNSQPTGYYLIEGTIDTATLIDRDGNEASIGTGMSVEARIVTQEKRIINYLLEKISLS